MTPQSPDATERAPVSHSDALGFSIDPPSQKVRVLRWSGNGCRPATDEEIALWDALQRPRQAAVQAEPVATTPGQQWKCGNEFLPYHPQASHVNPDHRDGWNACYRAALATSPPAPSTEAMRGWLEAMELLIEDAENGPFTVIDDDVLPYITAAIDSLKAAIGEAE